MTPPDLPKTEIEMSVSISPTMAPDGSTQWTLHEYRNGERVAIHRMVYGATLQDANITAKMILAQRKAYLDSAIARLLSATPTTPTTPTEQDLQ